MGSGKDSPAGTKQYFGTVAGIASLGRLDFIWGILMNNTLVYPPDVKLWDSKTWPPNKQILYSNGNVYKTASQTNEDPPTAPWTLLAVPWVAGTYSAGTYVVRNGYVWHTAASNSLAPGTTRPVRGTRGTGEGLEPTPGLVNGWSYVSTPSVWVAGGHHPANAIVAWKGQVYTTPSATSNEPPAAPWVRWRLNRVDSANPLKITIPKGGDVFLYWGTDDQVLDAVDEQTLNDNDHPPYRHRAFLVLKNFLFGTETTTPPDCHVLGGRLPVQTLITGAAADMDDDWQINPWCALAELLTHQVYGLGLPNSLFDSTTWQAEADRCLANPELFYISPMFTSLIKVRDLVADLLGYPDAFVFWNTLGAIEAGHWPHGEDAPAFDNTSTVNRDTLISELSGETEGLGGTFNSIEVTFSDIQAAFRSRPVIVSNLFNRVITQRLLAQKVDRPHIVRAPQALAWAHEYAKLVGDPTSTNQSDVRGERLTGVKPGSLFLVTDDVLQTTQVHRCVKRVVSAPPSGVVKISHDLERGVSPQPYSPTPLVTTPPVGIVPQPIIDFQFVQLPFALTGGPSRLACLPVRHEKITQSLQYWYKQADSGSYQLLGTAYQFGVGGLVDEGINTQSSTHTENSVTNGDSYDLLIKNIWNVTVLYDTGGGTPTTPGVAGVDFTVDKALGIVTILTGGAITTGSKVKFDFASTVLVVLNANVPADDIEGIAVAQTEDEKADNTLLLFLFQSANPSLFEICGATEVTASGGGYRFALRRQQYGTLEGGDGTHEWTDTDIAVAIFRKDLVTLFHESFEQLQADNSSADFILAPASPLGQAETDDIYDPAGNPLGLATHVTYTFENIYAPSVTWTDFLVGGVAVDFTLSYAAADIFHFEFTLNDRNADLVHGALIAVQGQTERTLWASNFTPSSAQSLSVEFSLPAGVWKLEIRLLDASGNQQTYPLTSGGDLVNIYVDNGTAPAPIVYAYNTSNPYIVQLLFGLLPGVADGYQLYYQIVARNAAPGSWTTGAVYGVVLGTQWRWGDPTYGSLPPIHKGSSGQTLYAYASQVGKTDSAVVKWNF